ncbi:alkaline phosphatase family protein [Sneathiella chungangensis]|uniref:Alkaline phosphatase family protein n=1 Tax=Sneathiella chungangensis TaxID=1418234 RepID=A0A845MDP4_9PROT|nr:alkaline phosphatase D family protein [Sneathiella chungangensis]MZR22163.1 alkaline phosphatase family protein [Sneathiella chungangensis]
MPNLKVGPILGVEAETAYTVIFSTAPEVQAAEWIVDGTPKPCRIVGETPSSRVWRGEQTIAAPTGQTGKKVEYRIEIDGATADCGNGRSNWEFYVPGKGERPKFAYASCNGFSSLDLMHKTEKPYLLWQEMAEKHRDGDEAPFSLLLLGGDQLYADSIWTAVPELQEWNALPRTEKITRVANTTMRPQIDKFYDKLYQSRWTDPHMSLMLASIPSVMMWDDHDIFDGWGSFPDDLLECEVFQYIFTTAKKYFEMFQIRSRFNASLLDNQADHYAFALKFRGYNVLALDNRAERTLERVMSEAQWDKVIDYLKKKTDGHLLVLSAVPVVYRDFSFTEGVFDATPWEEELTDDLKDHWRSKNHQGERARLIHRLLDNVEKRDGANSQKDLKTVILSGDVHIGCIGVIHDSKRHCKVHQVVSSGIVHPAPSRLQWIGIMTVTNDDTEYLDENRDIRISMLTPFASDQYIRRRNYVTLQMGTDEKLWVNWESEGKDDPCYPIQ